MSIIQEAYTKLLEKEPDKELILKYSGHFNDYNANISMRSSRVTARLSRKWKNIDKDIQIGLLQELLVKILKIKKNTPNMRMYNNFIKNIHVGIAKIKTEPKLKEAFERVNDKYFFGLIEITNLEWGEHSRRKLGSYEYGTDTIKISRILEEAPEELLDYVMYHEMLHKKHKFNAKNGRSYHHTSKFRKDEKGFENAEEIEKKLKRFANRKYLFGLRLV